jgi:hypothetical protein
MSSKRMDVFVLFGYLVIFSVLFGLSVYSYLNNKMILNIGFSTLIVNLGIMLLSVFSIIKTVWHIISL